MKPKYRYIPILLAIILAIPLSLSGQKRRGKTIHRQDISIALDSTERAYHTYHLNEAENLIQKINPSNIADSTTTRLKHLKAQIDKMRRMLPLTEELEFLFTDTYKWSELSDIFMKLNPRLGKQLSFTTDSNGLYHLVHKGGVGRYSWSILSDNKGEPQSDDIFRVESINDDKDKLIIEQKYEHLNTKEYHECNPFLLSDGLRLIFSSNRPEGLGGYDLYLSRYNIERNRYLEPNSLPLPFNSPYNDYFFAYDDERLISYLISDRYAEEGKVRLYVLKGVPKFVASTRGEGATEERVHSEEENLIKAQLLVNTEIPSTFPEYQETNRDELFLPLDSHNQIRNWADFVSSDALTKYQTYLQTEDRLKNLQAQYTNLIDNIRSNSTDVVQDTFQQVKELKSTIKELKKNQEKLIIEVKNLEIKKRRKL